MAAIRALFSASDEDVKIFNCFLVLHEISDLLRKKDWPDIDLIVSKHPSQSVYKYPLSCIVESLGNKMP